MGGLYSLTTHKLIFASSPAEVSKPHRSNLLQTSPNISTMLACYPVASYRSLNYATRPKKNAAAWGQRDSSSIRAPKGAITFTSIYF
jgi:hypothetical protein